MLYLSMISRFSGRGLIHDWKLQNWGEGYSKPATPHTCRGRPSVVVGAAVVATVAAIVPVGGVPVPGVAVPGGHGGIWGGGCVGGGNRFTVGTKN